ncbi:hypothetical protein TWF506_000423 [Arthrobotrys conoides]|uniref:Nucleoside phosphorylase domain-containing protein n=1 Tax=Arthrobotrys conoides TaxID=74498 RepID=A0AAN8NKX8_9PEZI
MRREDYTVGWICALREEMVSARIMMDKIHPPLSQLPNDTNTYILGSIGTHNIVIACLPEAGTSQAGKVATWMVSSFPNIKVGLMVGIGGGIPSKVKLGDIVVSSPTDQYPGVVQHDYGKREEGGFRRTGALNKPPTALLTALKSLQTEHDISGFEVRESLDRVKKLYPKLGATYTTRPNPQPNDSSTQTSPPDDNDLEIHYGLIVSGNQVIKDAEFRDSLDKSLGGKVLCIEMEAAGLMDDFPCMVIRGICDYADSRKNDDWHQYAAVVAAAYARDFLGHIRTVDVNRETPIKDILLRQGATIQAIHDDTKEVKSMLEDEDVLKFLENMTPIKHGPRHSKISQSRQVGTGQWFLDLPVYQNWLKNPKSLLHCRGIPRAGKTFITSRVIDDLFGRCSANTTTPSIFGTDINVGIAYIYLDYKQGKEQTVFNMLASLLVQLVRHKNLNREKTPSSKLQASLPETIQQLYEENRQSGKQPSTDGVKRALQSAVQTYSRVFIIIDAVDECRTSNSCRQEFLRHTFELHGQYGINIFSTSRDIQDITDWFETQKTEMVMIRAHNDDLKMCLRDQIDQSNRMLLKENSSLIETKIIEIANGMFPLVQLFFQSIEHKTSPKQLKAALEDLTREKAAYLTAYEDIMDRIHAQHPESSRLSDKVLEWVICAERPLTIIELQHALVIMSNILARPEIDFDLDEFPEVDSDDLPEVDSMISACAGLVKVDAHTGTFRLTHATAKEFFRHKFNSELKTIHGQITNICMMYLSSKYRRDRRLFTGSGALGDYILQNWAYHALKSKHEATFRDLAFDLLQKKDLLRAYCYYVKVLKPPSNDIIQQPRRDIKVAGISLAAHFGLQEIVQRFLRQRPDLMTKDGIFEECSPILWAVNAGHTAIVKLLVNHSTKKDISEAVEWAISGDRVTALEVLISYKDIDLRPILMFAIQKRNTPLVKRVLQAGAKVDDEFPSHRYLILENNSPIREACRHGMVEIVELLLQSGASPNWGPTGSQMSDILLLQAIHDGYTQIVKLLIRHGADIEVIDKEGKTAVDIATARERSDIVDLLRGIRAERERALRESASRKYTYGHGRERDRRDAERSTESELRNSIYSVRHVSALGLGGEGGPSIRVGRRALSYSEYGARGPLYSVVE